MAASNISEASKKYEEALRLGRKYLADKAAAGENGYLPVLDDILKHKRTDGELPIGLKEIALKKIVGTYASGRSNAFAGNFMPLLQPDTEFASKWRALYASHLKVGIREHIKVYEYLGYYYVVEGNKRVSVLNSVGAYSIHADVTRVIPHRTDELEIRIFYEMYDFDKRRLFDTMWFSRAGRFPKLIAWAREFASTRPELSSDAELKWMFDCYSDFRRRYIELGFGAAKHTTADAFYEYVSIFGFPYGMLPGEMSSAIQRCHSQFMIINTEEYDLSGDINLYPRQERKASTFSGLLGRRERALVALALPDEPETPGWSATHACAFRQVMRAYRYKADFITRFPDPGQSGYDFLRSLAAQKPGLILAASPGLHKAALRVSLEYPDTIVSLCTPYIKMDILSTYFIRFYEAAYVCGTLAGALTQSDMIGFIAQPKGTWVTNGDINAFAAGARLVNPRAKCRVIYTDPSGSACENRAKRKMAECGADIVLSTCPEKGPIRGRFTPEIGAVLCAIRPDTGNISEYLAGVGFNWEAYYFPMLFELTEGTLESSVKNSDIRPGHFRWGLGSGAIEILTADTSLGHYPVRLCRLFEKMIRTGSVDPLSDFLGEIDMHQGILYAAGQKKLLDYAQYITPKNE